MYSSALHSRELAACLDCVTVEDLKVCSLMLISPLFAILDSRYISQQIASLLQAMSEVAQLLNILVRVHPVVLTVCRVLPRMLSN